MILGCISARVIDYNINNSNGSSSNFSGNPKPFIVTIPPYIERAAVTEEIKVATLKRVIFE